MGLVLDKHVPDKRGDGHDGIRHREKTRQVNVGISQASMNTLTDGPHLGFSGQRGESLDRKIGYDVVKLTYQSLV